MPATILIAIGGFMASGGDTLSRFGMTEYFQVGKFLGVLFLFAGFLVSIEVFREIRVPFTSIRLGRIAARAGRRGGARGGGRGTRRAGSGRRAEAAVPG